MASFPCSAGDEQPAAYLLTDLADDTTINLCQPHMAAWAQAFLEAWAAANVPDDAQPEMMPEPEVATQDAAGDAQPATPKRTRKPRPTGNQS